MERCGENALVLAGLKKTSFFALSLRLVLELFCLVISGFIAGLLRKCINQDEYVNVVR